MAKTDTIVTKIPARLAFAAIGDPKENNRGQLKYGGVLLFPKDADISDLKALASQAVQAEWPDKSKRPGLKSPFRDGDKPNSMGNIPAGFAGHTAVNVSSNYPPGMVDQHAKRIIDGSRFYSGCYVLAEVNAYTYSANGNVGVSFGLNAIQFVRDGEKLGGDGSGGNPENTFRPVAGAAEVSETVDDAFEPAPVDEDDVPF